MKSKKCLDCDITMIEVRRAEYLDGKIVKTEYPKEIWEPGLKRIYNEYRYYCPKCKKEWIFNTLPHCRWFEPVVDDSQFVYDSDKRMLVVRNG